MADPKDISLRELERLWTSVEEPQGHSLPDLIFLAHQTRKVADTAYALNRRVEFLIAGRLDADGADYAADAGSSVRRTWDNDYSKMETAKLADRILGLDAHAFQELFEFVPVEVVTRDPHWKVKSALKLKNWIEKLGEGDTRRELERLLNLKRKNEKLELHPLDQETGEVL